VRAPQHECITNSPPPSLPIPLSLPPSLSCDTCIQREFARKTRGAFRCPACAKMGRDKEVLRQSLETKTREQLLVEMDTKWRERVLEVYGKREEEFGGDEEEYNDYVEQREDLSKCSSHPSLLPSVPHFSPSLPPSLPPFVQSTPLPIASSSMRTKSSKLKPVWRMSGKRTKQPWQNTRRDVKVCMYVPSLPPSPPPPLPSINLPFTVGHA